MDKNPRQITRLRYLDAKNLEKFVKSISYDSNTNTFEIGTNLYVDGLIQNSDFILPSNGEGMKILNDTLISFYLAGENTDSIDILPQIDEGLITFAANHRLDDGSLQSSEVHLNIIYAQNSDILTDQNVKTLFGNQSIYGSGNIDLYKHYLHIQAGVSGAGLYDFYILVQSSSNVNCSSTDGATQKLKDLLKISGSTPRIYETGVCGPVQSPSDEQNYSAHNPCALYWNGSLLYVRNDTLDFTITLIEDKVETV